MVKSEKITLGSLNPNDYNFKIKYSTRRMKLYIKLTKEETTGWKNVKNALAAGMSDDDLAKILFFKGISATMEELNEKISNMPEEEKAKIMAEYEKSEKSDENAKETNNG